MQLTTPTEALDGVKIQPFMPLPAGCLFYGDTLHKLKMENCVHRKELDAKCVHFEPNIKEQFTLEKNGTFLKKKVVHNFRKC